MAIHSNGHTYNPHIAADQGLTYTPPHDLAVLPNDDPQGVEIAAGFAQSMEDFDPDIERLPNHVDNNGLDLLDNVYTALRLNRETAHLDNVKVQVNQQVVYLFGQFGHVIWRASDRYHQPTPLLNRMKNP